MYFFYAAFTNGAQTDRQKKEKMVYYRMFHVILLQEQGCCAGTLPGREK